MRRVLVLFCVLAAITEAWLCATEQDKCKGKDYWTQYSYGALHAVIEQADLLAMSDVLKELFQSQYQSRMSCLGKESDIKIRAVQETETEEAIHQALKCVLGIDVTVTELEQRYALTKSYIEKNWQEPYFRGEATVLISTLIVPTAKGIGLIRKGILAKFRKAATFSKEIQTLEALSAAEGDIIKVEEVILTDLFKKNPVELFQQVSKSEIKLGNNINKSAKAANLEIELDHLQSLLNDLENFRPPYKKGSFVDEFILIEDAYFIRCYSNDQARAGRWIMSVEDFKILNNDASTIKDLYAIPNQPTKYAIVQIPKGTKIRKGIVAKIWDDTYKWGNGGATQFEILNWNKPKMTDWFNEIGFLK